MRPWRRRVGWWFRALFRKGDLEADLEHEIKHHLELETDHLVQTTGLSRTEAHRRARLAFGGVEVHKEAHRDARGVRWLEELTRDVGYAGRSLVRTPGFTVAAVSILALGIGSTTAVFSAADAVLFAPLGHAREDRLVRIYEQNSPTNRWAISTADYRGVQEHARRLSAVGVSSSGEVAIATGGEVRRAQAVRVTGSYLEVLGVRPAVGRGIELADERVGAPAVTLVSSRFARDNFGSEAAAVGQSVAIDGLHHTVVGTLPSTLGRIAGVRADLWPALQIGDPVRRGPFWLKMVARIDDGASFAEVRQDLAEVSRRILPLWQDFSDRTAILTPVPLRESVVGKAGTSIGLFAVAVGLVLLIAIANAASLSLVRTVGRWREVALRTTLGASAGRVVRLLVTESVMLALFGAAAGIGLGALGLAVAERVGAGSVPRLDQARLDLRAVGFALALALAAGAIVGGYPVIMLLRRDRTTGLSGGDRTTGPGRQSAALRRVFVVTEFALAVPLLASAGLLLNSLLRLERVEPGFEPDRLLAIEVSLPTGGYRGDSAIARFWNQALARVRELPVVASAGLSAGGPPNDPNVGENNFDLVDRPVPAGAAQPVAPWLAASADYFATLGIPLVAGRMFVPGDSATDQRVAIMVSRSWADRYFPGETAVGRRIIEGGCIPCPPSIVIGVVGDVRYAGPSGTADAVYLTVGQVWPSTLELFVRTVGPAPGAAEPILAALRSVDPTVPIERAVPMMDRMYDSVAEPRQWTSLVGGFAAVALGLAAIGIYGLLSYSVSARRREIGVRMALGAPGDTVVGMIVRGGMAHALAGSVIGLGLTLASTRALAAKLYQVSPTDPLTIVSASAVLLAVAALASWLPARRAAAIDPVAAMRPE
jgi:predicted permease